jgi:hypothetical protein
VLDGDWRRPLKPEDDGVITADFAGKITYRQVTTQPRSLEFCGHGGPSKSNGRPDAGTFDFVHWFFLSRAQHYSPPGRPPVRYLQKAPPDSNVLDISHIRRKISLKSYKFDGNGKFQLLGVNWRNQDGQRITILRAGARRHRLIVGKAR